MNHPDALTDPDRPTPAQRRSVLGFRLVAGILIAAAVVLNVTVPTMKVTFRKQPVEPRLALKTLPVDLGDWHQVSIDTALSHDTEQTLAATEYVFRTYVNRTKVPPGTIEQFETLPADKRLALAAQLGRSDPSAVIDFAMTYYTGSVDTVAHIPDRCYIASGYEVTDFQTLKWPVLTRPNGVETLSARYLTFEDRVNVNSTRSLNVAYFFNVNGAYESDPINGVRKRLQNLLEKYGYYSKVELKTETRDTALSQATMQDFLLHAMPEIEKVLPDWEQVKKQP